MPGGGSKPGERRGGRKRGVPNRGTITIEEVAKKHGLVTRPGQKLVKDDMVKLFEICLGMAARYQPSAAVGGIEAATTASAKALERKPSVTPIATAQAVMKAVWEEGKPP